MPKYSTNRPMAVYVKVDNERENWPETVERSLRDCERFTKRAEKSGRGVTLIEVWVVLLLVIVVLLDSVLAVIALAELGYIKTTYDLYHIMTFFWGGWSFD